MNNTFKKPFLTRIQSIAIALILIFIITIIALFYTSNLNRFLSLETQTYLKELSQQAASTVSSELTGDFSTLEALAVFISDTSGDNILATLPTLKAENEQNSFKRMGLITPDGTAYTTDGFIYDFSDRIYFQTAMKGITNVSDVLTDKVDHLPISVYAAPIKSGDTIIGVIFATNTIETYQDNLSISTFNGEGYSCIVNRDGSIQVASNHPNSNQTIKNIFDFEFKDDTIPSALDTALKENQSFSCEFYENGKRCYMSISPIGINNWSVLTVAPRSVVSAKTNSIIFSTMITWLVILLLFAALLVYIQKHQKKSQNALARLAYEDAVTGFSSWNKFLIDAEDLIQNFDSRNYAMVAFDIDKFKIINDLYGFEQDNILLSHIAKKISTNINDKETFCRIASDDFAILLYYENTTDFKKRVEYLKDQFADLHLDFSFTLSFGIYIIDDDTLSLNHILDRADMARKITKTDNGNSIAYFDTIMRNQIIDEKEIESEMAFALQTGQFKVYLQPKYDLSTHMPVGAEALVRWEHPIKGMIMPGKFIPLFEKNNFITRLDFYVFETICKKQREWIDQGYRPLVISSNFSRKHLKNKNLVPDLCAIVDKYKIPTECIELEVTESAAFDNMEVLTSVFKQLKASNFMISIDDFGTGYSSLNLLKELPVDILKMDKEFFSETDNSERSKQVVKNVISMAKDLKIKVVAEGVETKDQVNFLTSIGCDIVQGFYFARPMPIEDYVKLVYLSNQTKD